MIELSCQQLVADVSGRDYLGLRDFNQYGLVSTNQNLEMTNSQSYFLRKGAKQIVKPDKNAKHFERF